MINQNILNFTMNIDNANCFQQRDDICSLLSHKSMGIELGVAEGAFTKRLLSTNRFSHLYAVDMYAGDRNHDTKQYIRALKNLMPYHNQCTLIKARFDEVCPLFPDNFFDFIYIDGYAHTGQEEGQTLHDWYSKLRPEGLFCGDDYHAERWPKVTKAVDSFVAEHNLKLYVTPQPSENNKSFCGWPTWFAVNTDIYQIDS